MAEKFFSNGARIGNDVVALIPYGKERQVILTCTEPVYCLPYDFTKKIFTALRGKEDGLRTVCSPNGSPIGVLPLAGNVSNPESAPGARYATSKGNLLLSQKQAKPERLPGSYLIEAQVMTMKEASPAEIMSGVQFKVSVSLRNRSTNEGESFIVVRGAIPRKVHTGINSSMVLDEIELDRSSAKSGGIGKIQLPREGSSVGLLLAESRYPFGTIVRKGNKLFFVSESKIETEIPFVGDSQFTYIGRSRADGVLQVSREQIGIRRPEVFWRDSVVELNDPGSRNGTILSVL